MKKLLPLLSAVFISNAAVAETGLTIGLGYQTSQIANSEDLNGDPTGMNINVHYAIPNVDGMFVALDISDQEDEAELGAVDTLTTTHERTALKVGYVYSLDGSTSISAAIYNADIEWEWLDGRSGNFNQFVGDDSGVSAIVALNKDLGNGVTLGTALSLGFETGVEAFTTIKVIDNVDVRLSYSKTSYELNFERFDENGSRNTGTAFGDGVFQFDTSGFRVSANFSF